METATNRLWTVPNLVSLIRLCCIPVFVYLVFGLNREGAAAILLGVLGATDWIDGYIARRFNQVSAVGKFLDPATDRLLLAVAVITVVLRDAVPVWFALVAFSREFLIIGGGIYLALRGIRGLEVEYIGKAGALGLMFSLPFFLGAKADMAFDNVMLVFAWIFGIPGLVLNYISLWHYFKRARVMLGEQHQGRESEKPVAAS